ncbi:MULTISPECIES: alpha-amylase family protein [unclassified Bifidobacterium]|uniref:alpha-amylase family protein n=1 Tax=unclassified Bifidobacterium TaxID=2608897 RepID=UPI0015E28419|nr:MULTISPECIES: alpha-amylase family protein [unclassified Bifidobacterium]TPF77603.1 amylosucrase [Bifidobacterium sp. UTCIF-1]TPF79901.1 amylosucrase [Bifidobacterium sp. UTCIF-24]TPF81534.1 amylosucrase [Bifidobacterium sp. UTCIF-3]TPF84394.1 amylosucrase [Bifidobacterium sp. UTCIF-36]TPF88533.1 amylosucrase [Bifidobacterium sp. UTBIF-56]
MAQGNQPAQHTTISDTKAAQSAKTGATRAATKTAAKAPKPDKTAASKRPTAAKSVTAAAAAKPKRTAPSPVFLSRLESHKAELERLFMSLYGERETATEDFSALLGAMAEAYAERPADLKRLDKSREADPDWYKRGDMFGMTMYTDLFAGDLKKLADKIPYLKEQKLTYLHLMPLLQMPRPNNDGGYAVEDFDTVDPKLGTNEDLANLAKKLRRAGISLCIDFVMNHTASTHRWAKAAQAGDPEYQDYYFCFDDRTMPDKYEEHVPQVFPNTAPGNFTWNEQMGKWVMTQFYPFQWDLNYRNPKVLVAMLGSVMHLANLGVEVFRIDAVPYIWKELGTDCRNLPQVHTIVRMLRIILECVCPAVVLKGEVVMAPKELAAYFGTREAPECHMLYNVSVMVNLWSALASRDVRLLKTQIDKLDALPENCWFVNYLRCHDDVGWGLDEDVEHELGIDPLKHKEYLYHFYEGAVLGGWSMGELYNYDEATRDARNCGTTASFCGIEKAVITHDKPLLETSIRRDLLMHQTMAFLRGFPMLNCGDEIGQLNGWEYKDDPDRVEDSRNLHRSKFDWDKAALRKKPGTLQNRLWKGMEGLREMRHDPCFAPDAWVSTWDTSNDAVLAVVRKVDDAVLVGLFSFSEHEQHVHLNPGADEQGAAVVREPLDADLAPYEARFVRL